MRIIKTEDYNEMSKRAGEIIAAQINLKPDCVLGLATGSSPIGTYKELIKKYNEDILDFSKVSTVNLDEYKGLGPNDLQSYAKFMRENLFNHININMENTHIPNGLNENISEETGRYDELIHSLGGIDMQLLGIGVNGHIGFNEPADEFSLGTHMVYLTSSTIDANKRFFDSIEQVPQKAYTMGTREILQSHTVVLIASGRNKALAVKNSFFGPVTPTVPASILQLHKNFILIADKDALSMI